MMSLSDNKQTDIIGAYILDDMLNIILTDLAYRSNVKKCDISNNNSQLKCVIADVICYWSVRRCNVILRLKDVTNTCKRMRRSLNIGGSSSVRWRKVRRS